METRRLTVRPFEPQDLADIHRIQEQAFGDGLELEERESWLRWSILNQQWLPRLNQPPYGDQAVTLKPTGALIGAVGLVPLLAPFDQIPELRLSGSAGSLHTAEVGLYWVIDPQHQRRGYATEAAAALTALAFERLRLKRILAMTEYDNAASQGVMRKLGMQLLRNPLPEPAWLQVVGCLPNPS